MDSHFIFLLPIIFTIGWEMVFIFSGRWHMLHDRLLLAIIFCIGMICYITERALIDGTCDYGFVFLDNIEGFIGLSICPLLYFYTRAVTRDMKWHNNYWWYFVPGAVLCLIGTALSFMVGWDRIVEARGFAYQPFIPAEGNTVEWLYLVLNIKTFNLLMESSAAVLLTGCVILLIRYNKVAQDFFANIENSSVGHIRCFFVFAILLLFSTFHVTFLFHHISSHYVIGWLAVWFGLLIWGIAHSAYKVKMTQSQQDMILYSENQNEGATATANDNQSNTPVADSVISQKIREWQFREDKPYCKTDITLDKVAKDMDVHPRALSTYINKELRMNFNTWINSMRVEQAKTLLHTVYNIKINYVSAMCGFSDPAVFSRTFRAMVGISPQEYRDSWK